MVSIDATPAWRTARVFVRSHPPHRWTLRTSGRVSSPSKFIAAARTTTENREHLTMTEIRFRDQAGWQWEVVESAKRRDNNQSSDARRSLYFLNRFETRRIDDFPSDWRKKTSRELIQLCDIADPL